MNSFSTLSPSVSLSATDKESKENFIAPSISPSASTMDSDFSFLDLPSFRKIYTDVRTPFKMRFYVKGMKCAKCVKKVEDISVLQDLGVRIQVFLGESLVEVTLIDPAGSFAKVSEKIKNLGYEPIPLEPHLGTQQESIKEDREDLIRLAVMAACAGNIMTFAFAIYFGLSGVAAEIFNWICFALYLPVLFYGALPFYKGFWRSVRQKEMSIDGPMAVASVAGFIFSFVNLIRGEGSVYFDSLSGFLFLILVSRYVQKRLQKKFLVPISHFGAFEMNKARKIIDANLKDQQLVASSDANIVDSIKSSILNSAWSWSLSQDLNAGDQVLVLKNEIIPVDGWISSDIGVLSLAYLTGESKPQVFQKGMKVKAGTKVLEKDIVIRVESAGLGTQFGRLLDGLRRSSLSRVKVQDLSDKASQWLLWIVFSLSFVFLAFYWSVNPMAAIERSLALLILACPCAMAFGTPLALAFSLKKSIRLGLILKSGDVFEKILKVENVFFDKTGTLTEGSIQVNQIWYTNEKINTKSDSDSNSNSVSGSISNSDSDDKLFFKDNRVFTKELCDQLLLSLESISYHPMAFAIRGYFNSKNNTELKNSNIELLSLTDHIEKSSVGVFGVFQGRFFSVTGCSQEKWQELSKSLNITAQPSSRLKWLTLNYHPNLKYSQTGSSIADQNNVTPSTKESTVLALIQLELPLDPTAFSTIQFFKSMGKNVFLVSGDDPALVQSLGHELEIPAENVYASMTAESKAKLIQEKNRMTAGNLSVGNSMMVGDGVNDALALRQATVGVAVHGGVELAMENANVFMTQSGIGALQDLYKISQQAHHLIRRNLTISLIYNFIGGTMALTGHVNPFVAAVLMPISSGFILLSSWLGGRE